MRIVQVWRQMCGHLVALSMRFAVVITFLQCCLGVVGMRYSAKSSIPWASCLMPGGRVKEENGQSWKIFSPIHECVSSAAEGIYDAPVYVKDGLHPLPITEVPDVQMDEKEKDLLTDLLEKMICYQPEERITMEEVIKHPWFNI
ncbi:hypothetical protein BDP27DRAFT_1461495, partial [Rhodocollybia butyracea]